MPAEEMSPLMAGPSNARTERQAFVKRWISAYEIAMEAEGIPLAKIKAVSSRIIWGGASPNAEKAPWDR
jgi:hypothetical protein